MGKPVRSGCLRTKISGRGQRIKIDLCWYHPSAAFRRIGINIVEMLKVSGILKVVVERNTVAEFQRLKEFVGKYTVVCEQARCECGELYERGRKPVLWITQKLILNLGQWHSTVERFTKDAETLPR